MVVFPTWFNSGCYGGLACCMFAVAANALYTSLRQRGTTRQLAGAIVICVISALLLLPAIIWYNMRFAALQATLSFAEIEVALGYVALCGWILPLGVTSTYYLFTTPRSTTTSFHIPRLQRRAHPSAASALHPPRHQPGMLEPFVFDEDTPWGWLEYSGGNFQGQRLALKRKIATIGRDRITTSGLMMMWPPAIMRNWPGMRERPILPTAIASTVYCSMAGAFAAMHC